MQTVYKLTDQRMQTYVGYQWELGRTYTTSGEGDLCGPGWLHGYDDPLVGLFLNPVHANIDRPRLFVGVGEVQRKEDRWLKCGYVSITLHRELSVPAITTEQRVRFAIGCAWPKASASWKVWAQAWLDGSDRAAAAAVRAAWEAEEASAGEAARTAAWAAKPAAWEAARAAAWAAEAAVRAAWEAEEAHLPRIAVWAMGSEPITALYQEASDVQSRR